MILTFMFLSEMLFVPKFFLVMISFLQVEENFLLLLLAHVMIHSSGVLAVNFVHFDGI